VRVWAEKMKLEKGENRETEIRIDPYILAREIREMTRKGRKRGKSGKEKS
jgi:hypothetical protein